MGGPLSRLGALLVAPVSNHPLRTAGAVTALLAGAVMWFGITSTAGATAATSTVGGTVSLSTVVRFAVDRPAYPAAIVAGIGVLLLAD